MADEFTKKVRHQLYEIERVAKCPYCKKNFTYVLFVGHTNMGACNKPRCILQSMRDHI